MHLLGEPNNENFVTEKNRTGVKNGSVLRLKYSAPKTASDILLVLQTGAVMEKTKVLPQLSELSADTTFAIEFINQQGY